MPEPALDFTVDPDRCTSCGSCVDDCPARIIRMQKDSPPFVAAPDEANCIFCQHCLAICPGGAISIRGLAPQDSRPVDRGALPTLEQMDLLVRARRSFRRYRDADVDPALIDRLLFAVACAPTGVNRRDLVFTLIADKAVLAKWREHLLLALDAADRSGRLPAQAKHVVRPILSGWKAGRDVVFRNAPHLLLVSSPESNPCPEQDVVIALTYFELLAQSAGLGTVFCGYLRRVLEYLPECKRLLQLPQDHAYYPILFGLPAVRYARTVQRSDSARVRKIMRGPLETP
jgi:NAD-dependent dihydropyrimidine dehydrogenase PreA subunit/nitroreductase